MEKTTRRLPIVERDEWLLPAEQELNNRYERYMDKMNAIVQAAGSLVDYANGYRYFGWQRDELLDGWWLREWLPGAHDVYVFGDFNNWQRTEIRMQRDAHGVWSAFFPEAMYRDRLRHGSLYKLHVHGDNGWLDRIPAYARRVVQDDETKNYTAQFWAPEPFDWRGDAFDISKNGNLLIYEAHVGMAQEKEGVGTYREFTEKILPIIKKDGYNAVQLMAIAEHPYYGSFGYHVSSFFAPASRCGTPEELKELVRRAHELGLAVIMDLVHAHYVRNLNEGINELDGTDHHYSLPGKAGYQPYWDSKLFDYGKDEVQHFLLSNVKYWLDEFHFDGYRFDGVTSMIYHHHGYVDFDCRERFFDEGVNRDALTYLTLANRLVHDFRPAAVTIAEDVSGMPGMCIPIADGGIGFDYRLGMAIPDFWIKELKEVPDEQWDIREMWSVMTDRLPEVKTVAYAESHDQALVGDKTIAFRLMDKVRRQSAGHSFSYVDLADPEAIVAAIRPETRVILVETPTNPLLKLVDLAAIAALCRRHNLIAVADNTFASPWIQRPLELGFDVVMHSTTKYLNGHSDVIGGIAVVSGDERNAGLRERLAFLHNAIGSIAGPFDSFLVLRGIKTLAVRMDRHCANAGAVATMLANYRRRT